VIPSVATAAPSLAADLAHRVEAFEVALDVHPDADFAAYLPPPGHPLYLAALGELARVDLERAWASGRPKRVADYTARFPAVLSNPTLLAAVAFEEYRQRVRAGESARPEEYANAFGVTRPGGSRSAGVRRGRAPGGARRRGRRADRSHRRAAPGGRAAHGSRAQLPAHARPARRAAAPGRRPPGALGRGELSAWRDAAAALPDVGTDFVGFFLTAELGRGAFGRVYLPARAISPAARWRSRWPAGWAASQTRWPSSSTRTSSRSTRSTGPGRSRRCACRTSAAPPWLGSCRA
jgi:hypothetical protein